MADDCLARGEAAFVADLGIALAREYGADSTRKWQYRGVFDHLLRLLARTPGPENVAQALRLLTAVDARERHRYAASLLAAGQDLEDLGVVFAGGGSHGGASEELRSCLVHEMLLRGAAVADIGPLAAWATSPHRGGHPLAWLPLVRAGFEDRPDLPAYSASGSSYALPFGPAAGSEVPIRAGALVPPVVETTTPSRGAAMTAAVANWVEESNGRVEARTFEFAEPLGHGSVAAAVATLELGCLAGATARTGFSVVASSPAAVWRVLFAAASSGGAYNSGHYAAYGRLAAWRSLAALSGCAADATAGEVEARVQECAWYELSATTEWFEQVAWDLGVIALGPQRRALAVLAATDTD
ncbi:DUF6183 family protein [Nocardia sp. NPDC003345]